MVFNYRHEPPKWMYNKFIGSLPNWQIARLWPCFLYKQMKLMHLKRKKKRINQLPAKRNAYTQKVIHQSYLMSFVKLLLDMFSMLPFVCVLVKSNKKSNFLLVSLIVVILRARDRYTKRLWMLVMNYDLIKWS